MFKVIMIDGTEKLPDDNIYYMITKNGPYMRKKLGFIDCVVPVKTISILKDITPYATMSIPKIPADIFAQITAFFRNVYDEYQAESMVLMFLNTKTNKYYVHVPYQKVSAGGINYHRGFVLEDHIMVCSIHSHANFGAFHSGTDHDDERSFDGLHITIGKLGDKFVEIVSSIMVNGTRFKVDPIDYIEGIDEIVAEAEEEKEIFYYIGTQKIKMSGRKQKDEKQYIVETVDFDPEWMEKVEGVKHQYVKSVPRGIVFDEEYDSEFSLWSYYKHFGNWPISGKDEELTNISVPKETKEIKEENILTGPCKTCPFRNNISNSLKTIYYNYQTGETK